MLQQTKIFSDSGLFFSTNHTLFFSTMSMKPIIKHFFSPSRQYVVTGASNNPMKFGYKIFQWYLAHDLPVTPVNPKELEILGKQVLPNVKTILESTTPEGGVSISFLTPPAVSVKTLREIEKNKNYKDLIQGLWFQPGSYDSEVLEVVEELGLLDRTVHEDECILIRGEEGLYAGNHL